MAPPPGMEVRCAGCGETLEVEQGMAEFACPGCGTPQALPPELMPPRPRRALPLPRRGHAAAAPSRVACRGCGAVIAVPHGHGRFSCPLCGAEISASPLAAISIIEPPAAVPIPRDRLARRSEACAEPSGQSTRAGQVQNSTHSEKTYGQCPGHSFREDSFSSFRAGTGMDILGGGRLRNESANPSSHREESHTAPLNETISRPGKTKSGPASDPEYFSARNVQEEHLIESIPLQAQRLSPKSSLPIDKAESGSPNDAGTMRSKQKTGYVAIPDMIEDEQMKSLNPVVDKQQIDEIPHNVVHTEQVQVGFACKATGNGKKSAKDRKGNQKRQNNSLVNSSNELLHVRCSKRLSKGAHSLVESVPILKIDASPNQNQSEAPQVESNLSDPYTSSPAHYQLPHGGNDLDDVDAVTPPILSNGTQQAEQFPHNQNSPETMWVLPVPNSNSWHEHDIRQENFSGIDHCDKGYEEVQSNPSETQNDQDMDGKNTQEACSDKKQSRQVQLKPHSENVSDNGRQKRNGFNGSSLNDMEHEHPRDGSFSEAHHQINLSASCSRLAALLPVPATKTLPMITPPSSCGNLPHNCSSQTLSNQKPAVPLYSQDARAHCGDMLQEPTSISSKKRKGRWPDKLMEPRKEADRPVLTPSGTDWNNYPGTYVADGTSGNDQPCEHVVYHWHQCPLDIRAAILDEFLKRYKWSPGKEEECQKIFDRKAVRQLANLFCYEKQRAREGVAAKKAKRYLAVHRARQEMEIEEDDGREDLEKQQGDDSMVVIEHDDPRKWKPFVPGWMKPKWWEMLCDHWSKDEVLKVSYQKRRNRNSGKQPCNTAGSQSVLTHQQLLGMDNSGKLAFENDSPTEIPSGKGGFIKPKDTTDQYIKEAGVTQLVSHPSKGQVGNWKHVSNSFPGANKHGQHPMFTKEQVQEMINQAVQGLNEVWEKKFLSLEKKMSSMSSLYISPGSAKESSLAVGRDKHCRVAQQDTSDSVDGEDDPADGDDGEGQDEEEHSS
ncbi:hypothetical protein ACP4OV_026454 [Aristida adscensionis]